MVRFITGGLLVDGTGAKPRRDVGLVVEDGRIVEVGAEDRKVRGARTSRFPRHVLMPGLIDSHAHLELSAGPDHETGRRTRAADEVAGLAQLRALANAQLALVGGITTLQDCGSSLSILGVREAIARGAPGPRLRVAGPAITTTAGHGHWLGTRADSEQEIRTATRWLIEQGVDVIKIVASGGVATAGSNPLEPQYSVHELRAAVTEAHRLGRRVVAHALNAEAIRRCVAAGIDVIDHCWWQRSDGPDRVDADVVEQMVSHGITVGLTGSGVLRVLLDDDTGRAELRRRLTAHRAMREAGVRMTIHSDGGSRFTYFDQFDRSLAVMVSGLAVPPADAIQAATRLAADSMGIGADVGTLEAGRRADVLVLESDPLDDIANLRGIRAVLRDGEVLVDHGRLAPRALSLEAAPA